MISEVFEYEFMRNALLTGFAIAGACSLLGIFLILRRLSMLGDGLAHAAFGGIAVGLLFKFNPTASALIFSIINAFIVKRLMKNRVYGDAAIAVIFSFGMALAVVLIGISKTFKSGVFSYLFGSILTANETDIVISFSVFVLVASLIMLFYKKLFLVSFNEEVAWVSGIKVERINTILIMLSALVIVVAIKIAGILLASAFLVLPALSALRFSTSFKGSIIASLIISEVSTIAGIIASFYLNLPTSGVIVLIMIFLFFASIIFSNIYRKI